MPPPDPLAVTAVVAVRNGADYLAAALGGILAQTRPVAEIVVVDGRSSDDTVAIARDLGARVVTQPGTGIPDAYNHGIAESCTPLIAFCSHDDRWTADKVEVQVAHLAAHPALAFTHAHFTYVVEEGFRPPPQLAALVGSPQPGPIMETLVARREVFDRVGGFDPTMTNAEDLDWLARARDLGEPSAMLSDCLLVKRLHGANTSLAIEANNAAMLAALRRSVARKRTQEGAS